jgi:plastocyanin
MEGEEFLLDTNKLEIGEYEYFCSVHPWMIATLIIGESKENIKVTMPDGAGIQQIGQKYYDPEVLEIPSGTTVVWENEDTAIHTVTSGNPQDGHNGVFDSDVIPAGKSYQFTFSSTGVEEYYCIVHPWMMGSVKVN